MGGVSVAVANHHITPQEKKLIAGAKKEGSVSTGLERKHMDLLGFRILQPKVD